MDVAEIAAMVRTACSVVAVLLQLYTQVMS